MFHKHTCLLTSALLKQPTHIPTSHSEIIEQKDRNDSLLAGPSLVIFLNKEDELTNEICLSVCLFVSLSVCLFISDEEGRYLTLDNNISVD